MSLSKSIIALNMFATFQLIKMMFEQTLQLRIIGCNAGVLNQISCDQVMEGEMVLYDIMSTYLTLAQLVALGVTCFYAVSGCFKRHDQEQLN